MCERTKVEVLAREFAAHYWTGMVHESGVPKHTNHTSLKSFVDGTWKRHKKQAKRIIEALDKHN